MISALPGTGLSFGGLRPRTTPADLGVSGLRVSGSRPLGDDAMMQMSVASAIEAVLFWFRHGLRAARDSGGRGADAAFAGFGIAPIDSAIRIYLRSHKPAELLDKPREHL